MGAVMPWFERQSLSSSRKSEIFERPRLGVQTGRTDKNVPTLTRFTPGLKARILSLNQDRSNGCVAQPSTYLFDRESGTFTTREQVVS